MSLSSAGERRERGTLEINTEEVFSHKLISWPVPRCRNLGLKKKKALGQKGDTYIKYSFIFRLYSFYLC